MLQQRNPIPSNNNNKDDEVVDMENNMFSSRSHQQQVNSEEETTSFSRFDTTRSGSKKVNLLTAALRRLCCFSIIQRRRRIGGFFILLLLLIILVLVLGLRWFIYVYNGPELVLEMRGPLNNNKESNSLYLVKTNTNPSFMILTLSPESDVWISNQLVHRGWWESAIEKTFEEVLESAFKNNPNFECNMIDVGGNLGFFSLLSAAYGCQVTTYEVQPEMANKIRTSAAINGFKNIQVKNNAVSSVSGKSFSFGYGDSKNKGSAYAFESSSEVSHEKIVSVALNDDFQELIRQKKRITILKIDVEGNEGSVLEGANQLLPYVDNTVVEVTQHTLGVLKALMDAGFNKLTILKEPRLVWGYFVKRAPSQTLINPSHEDVAKHIINARGKSDVWLSRV